MSLAKCPGWDRFLEVVKAQENVRIGMILQGCETKDDVLKQEFLKGEVSFARTLANLPDLVVEELEAQLKENGDEHED